MKKTTRRVYMSVLLVVLSLFTAVATTFAWVGITTNTTFDKFTINLKKNEEDEQSEYGIQLSLTGNADDFHDEIRQEDLYRQILLNMGHDYKYINRLGGPVQAFRSTKLLQCTAARTSLTLPSTGTMLTSFYDMAGNNLVTGKDSYGGFMTANGLIFFDLYLSIYSISGDVVSTAPTIFLKKDLITSENCSTQIMNKITLNDYFNKELYGKVNINAANSCRAAFQRYDIVEKGKPESYDIGSSVYPNKLTIYQTGSTKPTYDGINDLYDFGGVMELENNFAYQYYSSIHGDTFSNLNSALSMDRIVNRGDVVYRNGDTLDSPNVLVPYTPSGEGMKDGGLTSNDMIKFRIYFWFEGWDGDCIDAINDIPVSLNLVFSTKTNAA
ncbi:MAG: hypothetical protein K6E20_02685 [Acholeplasmatales bacterium]|nr:hypothetical protein [Acholeplasmatales bacterium]